MAKKTDFSKVDIKTIKEGERFRKDYDQVGINDLAKSIDTSGLLQPLGVDERGVLIWGGRRFRAIELLIKKAIHSGDTERAEWLSMVPAIIVDLSAMASEHNGTAGRLNEIDPEAARDLIKIGLERTENEMRRDFNDSERFAIAQRVEEIQKQANSANMRKGRAMTADFEKRNEIKDMILDGVPQRKIADELGVGRPTVQKAVKAIKDGNDLYFDERTTKVNFEKNNHSCPGSTEGRANWSQDKAGEAVGVSGTAYRNMKKTQSLGSSELIEARDEDKVSRAVAADIAELSKAEQANVNFDDKASIKEAQAKGKAIITARKDAGEEARGRKKITYVVLKTKAVWVDEGDYDAKMKQVVDSAIDGAESLMEQDMDFAGALGKELYRLSSIADLESKIK